MFDPRYTIKPNLLDTVKRIALLVQELNRNPLPSVVLAEMERSARALSAHSSTSIEGNPLPLTDVKRILKQTPAHIRSTEREVLNYNAALGFVENLLEKESLSMSPELICKIQEKVIQGLIEPHRTGSLRTEPVFVNDPRTGTTIYLPPESAEVKKLIEELCQFVRENEGIIDPVILAGLFHKQFVIIHPFVDGNGRTTRLATNALLAKLNLNTLRLFSFENYYNSNVTRYFDKVGLRGEYYELRNAGEIDFSDWLEYFAEGILDELLRVKKELEKVSIPERGFLPEQQLILTYLEDHTTIAERDYAKLTKRARSTRVLDLKRMVALGLLEKVGKGKSTYYRRTR